MLHFQPLGFQQRILETPFGILAYYVPDEAMGAVPHREDRQSLVFLHSLGGGSSAFEWSKVYPAFAYDYQVIAPDLIGWGQSTHPVRNYRPEDYEAILTTFLETVALGPAHIVASSLTAGIVIRLAIQRPELFQSLFLVSPSGNGDFGKDYRFSLPAQLAATPLIDQLIYQLGAANQVAVSTFLSTFLFADAARITPEMVQAYLTGTQQPNAEYAALASLRGDICFDLSLYVGQLKVPTAFVWGQKSRFSPPEFGRRLAQLNPKAVRNFYEIPHAGVLAHLEQPAVIIGLLQRFLTPDASVL